MASLPRSVQVCATDKTAATAVMARALGRSVKAFILKARDYELSLGRGVTVSGTGSWRQVDSRTAERVEVEQSKAARR